MKRRGSEWDFSEPDPFEYFVTSKNKEELKYIIATMLMVHKITSDEAAALTTVLEFATVLEEAEHMSVPDLRFRLQVWGARLHAVVERHG